MPKAKDFANGGGNGRLNSLQQDSTDTFGGPPPPSDNDEVRKGKKERVEQVDIFKVQPDLTQPRRAMPSVIRAAWDGQTATLSELFSDWRAWAQEAGWLPLVDAVLNGEEIERPAEIPAEISALLEIAGLAASIQRDGLMNPVTLAKQDDGYHLESGERRWLAFHLLYASTGDDVWRQIPARLVVEVNRWRQAAENNTRADLNAIGKARQFAVLLMELWAAEGEQFAAFDSFTNEQAFYAQVAEYSTPYGKSQLLLNAMGIKHRSMAQRYRDLLALPGEIWTQADDSNCPEGALRKLVGLPVDEALVKLYAWQRGESEIVAIGNNVADEIVTPGDNVDDALSPIDEDEADSPDIPDKAGNGGEKTTKDLFSKFATRQLKDAKRLDRPALATRVSQIRELLKQLEQALEKKR